MESFLLLDELDQLIERHNEISEGDPLSPPHGGGRSNRR